MQKWQKQKPKVIYLCHHFVCIAILYTVGWVVNAENRVYLMEGSANYFWVQIQFDSPYIISNSFRPILFGFQIQYCVQDKPESLSISLSIPKSYQDSALVN